MKPIYIAFGANLSNPKLTFTAAMSALEDQGVAILKMSGLWQSPAWPAGSDQPDYINACAEVDYEGSARQLLDILHKVEAEFGRERSVKNAARTLDLDLLDFRGQIITEQGGGMIIPHPRMLSRGFVLFHSRRLPQIGMILRMANICGIGYHGCLWLMLSPWKILSVESKCWGRKNLLTF